MTNIQSIFHASTSRENLHKLGELLVACFACSRLESRADDTFSIEIDDDPAIYVASNGEALCWSAMKESEPELAHRIIDPLANGEKR